MHVVWLLVGLGLLSFGADWLVRGASEIALRAGLTPLVVGLTVVAFGTSAPELIVSLKANLDPVTKVDIAIGNVVGSNICNIALMFGLAALIRPLVVGTQVVRRELPILLVVTGVFVAMIWDGELARWEGILLASGLIYYVYASIRLARRIGAATDAELPDEALAAAKEGGAKAMLKSVFWVVLGLGALLLGADRLVGSGVALAQMVGVPEVVIGLTLVAVGTSLPELATTVAAARRGETDIIAGNIIGSNLFNIMAVMGIASSIKPMVPEQLQRTDLWVMSGFTLLLVPFLVRGARMNRWEGAVLLVCYGVYCTWLVKPDLF